ncbi:uncharacterized protein PF11_0207-like [Portunus trituberculatus]|uniref:uncharacterized protein PF11_0207-like n=1 Tax=Portunus trituberculatus TaxID=210409 RepID=UPI001E1CC040|nr:uncharacterized protein PF11_0207-like [Portunus trituberculatus]
MFRVVVLLSTIVALGFVLGASVNLPARTSGRMADPVVDAEDLSANVAKASLAAEKQILDKEVCAEAKKDAMSLKNGTLPATMGEKGPKKVVITQTKVEEFPKNGTKLVTVIKTAEKLSDNETREQTEIERKTIKDVDDTANPKKNITIEKKVENTVCKNKTAEAMKPSDEIEEQEKKILEIKQEIKDLKQETERVKEKLAEEIKEKEKEKGELKKEIKVIEEVNVELKEVKGTETEKKNEGLKEVITKTEKAKEDLKEKMKETEEADEDLKENREKAEGIEQELREDTQKVEKLEEILKEKTSETENLKDYSKEATNKTVMTKEELEAVKNKGNKSCESETKMEKINAKVPAADIEKKSVETAAEVISPANTVEKIVEKVVPEEKASAATVEKPKPPSEKNKPTLFIIAPKANVTAEVVNGTKLVLDVSQLVQMLAKLNLTIVDTDGKGKLNLTMVDTEGNLGKLNLTKIITEGKQ